MYCIYILAGQGILVGMRLLSVLDIRMRSEASHRDTWRVDHADWSMNVWAKCKPVNVVRVVWKSELVKSCCNGEASFRWGGGVKAHCSTNRPFFRRLLQTPPSFSSPLVRSPPPIVVTLSSLGSGILILMVSVSLSSYSSLQSLLLLHWIHWRLHL